MESLSQRQALELLWKGSADVYVRKSVKNEVTKLEEFKEVKVLENIKCKLGYPKGSTSKNSDGAMEAVQSPILILANEIDIPVGSKITVSQNGFTETYYNSGKPTRGSSHQQISLKLFKEWA